MILVYEPTGNSRKFRYRGQKVRWLILPLYRASTENNQIYWIGKIERKTLSLRSSCRGYKLFCWFIGLNNSQQQQLSHSKPDVTMGDQSSYEMTQAVHNCSTGGNPTSSGTVGVGGSGLGQPGNSDATAVKRRSTVGTLDNGDLGIPLPPPPLNVISTSAALIKRGEKRNLYVAIQNGHIFI